MILGALRTKILLSSGVTNLIDDKLFPIALPQGVQPPAADMRIVTTSPSSHLGGSLGLYISAVTIDCYHDDDIQVCDSIAMAILGSGVVGYKGLLSGIWFNEISESRGISHSVEGVDPGSDRYRYVSSITLDVHWSHGCQ